jgi:hypothetical protein
VEAAAAAEELAATADELAAAAEELAADAELAASVFTGTGTGTGETAVESVVAVVWVACDSPAVVVDGVDTVPDNEFVVDEVVSVVDVIEVAPLEDSEVLSEDCEDPLDETDSDAGALEGAVLGVGTVLAGVVLDTVTTVTMKEVLVTVVVIIGVEVRTTTEAMLLKTEVTIGCGVEMTTEVMVVGMVTVVREFCRRK